MKRLSFSFLVVFLMILSLSGLFAQDRGLSVVAAENLGSSAAIGKQYALFIAVDAYRTWPALKKPVADAREIRSILEKDYFIDEIIELHNQKATREKIVETFEDLQEKLGVHDSLFIYYAGHGHLDNASKQGYWIPVDGGTNQRTKENWLPNSEIRGYISGFKTIHVFMVSDSCFSGDILNTNRSFQPQIDNAYYRKAYGLTSRQVLTSGSSEKVPDQSEFSEAIKNCLRKNTAPLLDPLGIYNDVRLGVQSTTPLYGTLNQANHQEGATFLFFRKQTAQPSAPTTARPTAPIPQQPSVTGGSVTVESEIAGEIFIDGQATGRRIKAGGTETISNVSTGSTEVWVKDSDGATVKAPTVMVRQGQTASVAIERPIPEGLAFEIVDGKSVTITKYTGEAATVHIPEKIQGLPVTVIGRYAFYDCDKLTSISIPPSVTNIGTGAVRGGNSLTSITVDRNNPAYSSVDGVLFDKNIKTIIQYPRGKKETSYSIPSSVTNIVSYAFDGCKDLSIINIPSSVTTIGEAAVAGGNNLTNITVDSRNSAFSAVDGVLFDKNVKTIIQYPRGKKETSYSIPFSVTTIGDSAFWYCKLTGISIPPSVTSIGDDAFFCSNLTSISIPSSVTSIGNNAFSYCKNLTSITIPSSITKIDNYMFRGCGFTSITIPSSVTSIGASVFVGCNNLTSITIPSSVTTIGSYAFWYCNNLTSITIPSSVTTIGSYAFDGCSKLTSVTLSRKTKVAENAFPDSAKITYSD